MQTINKIILTVAILVSIYILTVSIIAVKQHYKIKDLQDNNADYQSVIAWYKQDIESPEFKAVKKCKKQDVWVAECISWELNK